MAKALHAAERVDRLPCAAVQKARAVATTVIPKMLKGTQWTIPSKTSLKQLLGVIMMGLWSRMRKMRAPEVVIAALNDSTRVDPWGATVYACMMVARRALHRSPPPH